MRINSFLQQLPGGRALTDAKDRLLAKAATDRFNKKIHPYGTMLDLHLNTVEKSVSVSFLLKGEQSPIEVRVPQYAISRAEDGKLYLEIDGATVETSREWLTRLIRDKVGRRKIEIPPNIAWATEVLI
jgi:hypothetical protein